MCDEIDKEARERLHCKIDKVDEKLNDISLILERNTISLEYITRRADLLEREIEATNQSIKPLETQSKYIQGVYKFLGLVALVSGIILTFIKLRG